MGSKDLRAAGAPGAGVADGEVLVAPGPVTTITINRPERRNAMSWGVIGGIRSALMAAKADPDVRVVVLRGAGDDAFCAGADLGGMSHGADGFLATHEARGQLAELFDELWSLGKPTIARVQGWAMAGGFGLALACDMVVASERARFGASEIKVGLWPFMITVPLVRSMPPKRALELMMTGRVVDAQEADRLGFVTSVVPHEELDDAVDKLAAALAASSPAVMKLGRDAFYAVWDMAASDALVHLHAMLTLTNQTEDAAEGIAAFLDKRPPSWRGR
ncbi:MAG: enoyl-CoA hydratase/isomerase family protein [Acidimicrobiales bacterium]